MLNQGNKLMILLVEMRVTKEKENVENIIRPGKVIPPTYVLESYRQLLFIVHRFWNVGRRMTECNIRRTMGKNLVVALM